MTDHHPGGRGVIASSRSVDVLVLGGGPAGGAAARRLAAAGASVALAERSEYETFRVGETLPPESVVWLARLGLSGMLDADGHTPAPGTVAAWGGADPHENDFVFSPYGHGWHLDRRRFDQGLSRAAAEAGADVVPGATAVAVEDIEGGGGLRVTLRTAAGRVVVDARWVIDATGRSSWLARRRGARRRCYDRLRGTVGVFDDAADADPRTFIEATPDGWWYSSSVPGRRAVAVFFTDADPRGVADRWDERLRATRLTRDRLAGARRVGRLRSVPASSTLLDRVAGDGWLAAGDAACTLDPLSSQGICWALAAGIAAADVILENDPRAAALAYAESLTKRFGDYLHTRRQYYDRERRWAESAFWRRQREGVGGR